MREIKFRVWTGLEMEYKVIAGELGAFYAEGLAPKDSACISPFNTKYSEEAPIMQFTGLKDKNGKEIYEGDVVKIQDGTTADVYFDVDGGWFLSNNDLRIGMLAAYDYREVIGNIYENPELLAPTKGE